MKKFTKMGFIALASMLLFATACKKSPSAAIYKTWTLESVDMPDMDNVAVEAIKSEGLTYTFSKNGNYSKSGAMTGEGTFEINEEGTSLSTTSEGKTDIYTVMLTESTLKLSEGNQSMTFTSKK